MKQFADGMNVDDPNRAVARKQRASLAMEIRKNWAPEKRPELADVRRGADMPDALRSVGRPKKAAKEKLATVFHDPDEDNSASRTAPRPSGNARRKHKAHHDEDNNQL
jgi:hypothetical protein